MALPAPGSSGGGSSAFTSSSNLVTAVTSLFVTTLTPIIRVPPQFKYVLQSVLVNTESGANRVYSVTVNIDGTERQIAGKSVVAAINDRNDMLIMLPAGSTVSGFVDNADTPVANCFLTYGVFAV